MDTEDFILGGRAGEGEDEGVGVQPQPASREEDKLRAIRSRGLKDPMLQITDEGTGIQAGGFTEGDWGGAEYEVVGTGGRGVGWFGGRGAGVGLLVQVEVGNDLLGKVRVLNLLPKLGVESGKELGTGHFQQFFAGEGGREGVARQSCLAELLRSGCRRGC